MKRAISWIFLLTWLVLVGDRLTGNPLSRFLNTLGTGNTSRATPAETRATPAEIWIDTSDPSWCSRITDFHSNFREAIANRYGTSPSNIWFGDSGLVNGFCIVSVGGADPLATRCVALGAYRLANGAVAASGSSDSCFP